jgi:hypothetical protein
LRAGVRRGPGVRRDVENLLREDVGRDRQHDVGEHGAGDEVDLLLAHVALGELLCLFGFQAIVGDQHLGGQAAEASAVQLDRELERVADVDADRSVWPGQRADESDLHLVRAKGRRGAQQQSN